MRVIIAIVVILLIGGTGWLGWQQLGNASNPASAAPTRGGDDATPVRVKPIERQRFGTRIESLGTARSRESVTISASVTATVAAIEFDDGDQVEAGQILVRLASEEEFAMRREAEVAIAEARRELRRIDGLAETGIIPRQQVDQQRSRLSEAEARLEAVDARLADRVIRAPFTGVLGIREVSPGSLVSPGTMITELDDIKTINLDFTVPERHIGRIAPGQRIEASSIAFDDETFDGTVTVVSTRVDVATRSFVVRARIDNPENRLRPGMLLTTRLELDASERPAVPESAIVPQGDERFVFIVNVEDRAERLLVETGQRAPGWVEIRSGLPDDARVVVEGVSRIRDGATVRVLEDRT